MAKRHVHRLLALVCSVALAHRAYAGVAATVADSVTGLYVPGRDASDPWEISNYHISAINLNGVSHVYYAFLWILESDSTVYDPIGNLDLLLSLKSRWPATNLILSIGGVDATIWTKAVTTGLTAFVNSAIAAMKAANADGIDLYWESPDASTRTAFTGLAAVLRARLDAEGAAASPPRHYWLTAATQSIVAPGSFDGFDLPALKSYVDLFNIMTYSMHDPCWETETHFHTAWSECAAALEYYINAGVPRTQLVLGLAFYGHEYRLLDPYSYKYPAPSVKSRDCSIKKVSYGAILLDLSTIGGSVFVDVPQRSAYYVRGTRWVGFDIPETMALKIQGARTYGVGGVMIWNAAQDTSGGELLRSVASRQTNISSSPHDACSNCTGLCREDGGGGGSSSGWNACLAGCISAPYSTVRSVCVARDGGLGDGKVSPAQVAEVVKEVATAVVAWKIRDSRDFTARRQAAGPGQAAQAKQAAHTQEFPFGGCEPDY